MNRLFPCPRILSIFQKRIDGDDALLQLATLRFKEFGLGTEFYAETPMELEWLLRFKPFPDTPAVVHLSRRINLFDESSREQVIDFAKGYKDQVFGLVVHDQAEIINMFEDYVSVLREMDLRLNKIARRPYIFIEYAAGLEPELFISIFKAIRDLEHVSACIDISHIGLWHASTTYSRSHPNKDIFAFKPTAPELPVVIEDIESAVHSAVDTVSNVIQKLSELGKPLHLHLHDAHPLSTSSPFGISDHLSFLDKIPIPFEYKGEKFLDPMFGPSGLSRIVTESLSLLGPERVSFSLEIHPGKGRISLGWASYLFNHWKDKGNAERMNFWLSVINENYRLLLKTCGIKEKDYRWPEKMHIYNLFPLLAGKFTDWEKHLLRASEMGFNWVFVNPIQRHGASGSIYSIADHFAFNPLLVDPVSEKPPQEQVKDMIKTAEKLGLKLMIDLVINHCAVDSELIKSHPEWFLWKEKGQVENPFVFEKGRKVIWKDLAKFDHRNTRDKEGLFQFFLNIVKFMSELGFKGFRCDAAYQVPRSLWERLINEIKKQYPDILFFAETLGSPPDLTRKTAGAGFDYIFNSSKWWNFSNHWLMEQYALTRDIAPSISFPESHDTARLCDELNGNIEGLKQRYLFSAIFSSGVMMPIGFEFGFRRRLHVVKTKQGDWEETGVNLTSFITKVNKIKAEHAIFQEDAPTEILPYNNPNILLMWKASTRMQEEFLLILNKDIYNKQYFYAENLQKFFQSGTPLIDVSPEYPLDYIPMSFSYDLRPGQGIVLITSRNSITED